MWHSISSTGVQSLADSRAPIDAVIGHMAAGASGADEVTHLMDVYCSIIAHIRSKNDLLGPTLSVEERNHDAAFLREVRHKIHQRDDGVISRRQLIRELRHMLMMHAMTHETRERTAATTVSG